MRERKEEKKEVVLSEVSCPICGNPINWFKVVEHTSWAGKIVLLAECWSGTISEDKPKHLFLIELDKQDLPIVYVGGENAKE